MRPNVKFRVELPKTNPNLAKSHFQQKTRGYTQKNHPQQMVLDIFIAHSEWNVVS